MINQELYIPKFVRIASVRDESALVKSYGLRVSQEFGPGQFFQVSVLGAGEVPISVSSSPTEKRFIQLTVRQVGRATSAIHNLRKDDFIGVRGPYGSVFPVEELLDKDLIFVAGGIGLAPLRSLIKYVLDNRKKYGKIYLLYGAKTPQEMIFKNDLQVWQAAGDVNLFLTVDLPDKDWKGNLGVVTTLLDKVDPDARNCVAVSCGPPVMIKYTIQKLLELGFNDKDIVVSLERYMNCGVGKCGHCYLEGKYVCTDGPVFTLRELRGIGAKN